MTGHFLILTRERQHYRRRRQYVSGASMSSPSLGLSFDFQQSGHLVQQSQRIREAVDELYLGLLNDVHKRLSQANEQHTVSQALDELFLGLRSRKLESSDAEWSEFVDQCRQHPLIELLHQDPFTFRAYSKPRGYAGDAVMMDFIYGREERWLPPPAQPIGSQVFQFTTSAPASEGVRARRAFIAGRIDRLAERKRRPHILAIASGHLREVNLSSAARRARVGRYVALDADMLSLREVELCYAQFGVETAPASFRELLANRLRLGRFDLVYSTGLFDYLKQTTGRRLVSAMFRSLRPGGRLLVANFLPGVRDVGYMEAFMDWNLTYRTRQEMIDLTTDIPEAEVRYVRLFAEEHQNILFLELARK